MNYFFKSLWEKYTVKCAVILLALWSPHVMFFGKNNKSLHNIFQSSMGLLYTMLQGMEDRVKIKEEGG